MKLLIFAQSILSTVLLVPVDGKAQEQAVSLERIVKAWQERTAKIQSFSCSWEGTRYEHVHLGPSSLVPEQNPVATAPIPENVTYPFMINFIIDNRGRVRFDYEGKQWSVKEGKLVPDRASDLFDGADRVTFFPAGGAPITFPGASIKKATGPERDRRTVPFLMALRPFDASVGLFNPSKMVLTEDRGVIDGRQCAVLRHDNWLIWVDPALQFLPVRFYEYRDGTMIGSLDIGYIKDTALGWVPSKLKDVWLTAKGIIYSSTEAVVSECTVNQPIPDETYKIDYPPGTWVNNYNTNERYLVRNEGKRRPILPGEFNGTNYEQILNSEPPGSGWRRWRRIGAILAVSIVVVGFLLQRRRRLRARQSIA